MNTLPQVKSERPYFRFLLWAKRIKLSNKAAIILAVGAFLSGVATYATFSNQGPFAPTPTTLYVLLLFNLVLLLCLGALVSRQLVRIWAEQKSRPGSAKLHSRIVTLFSLVAITPTVIVSIFSALFFEFGLQSWFSDKVRTVLDNSQSVSEAYINEHRKVIKADILGMAKDLNSQALLFSTQPELLEQTLGQMAQLLGLSEAIIFDRNRQVTVQARNTLSLLDDRFPDAALESASSGKVVFLTSEDDNRIRTIVKLDAFIDQFLYVSRFVDARALALVNQASASKADFERVLGDLSAYRLWFNLTFIVIALLILLVAVSLGLGLANKLMQPIGNLVDTSEKVGQGDLTARAPIEKAYDDLGGLTRAFNNMTRQLQSQQKALMDANAKLDERRRFTETILSGVSAGIIGLDPDGLITLPNRAALQLLQMSEEDLIGQNIVNVMPEADNIFTKVRKNRGETAQDQVSREKGGVKLNLMVRITAEMKDQAIQGFVVTFDDITEQVAAQRTAAWADVARRIAHEIKNPLTPIQLSAERLKRKYGQEIQTDPAIFDQCTNTIIRQVGDLRQMVDEFSSFSRLPTPVIKPEKLNDLVKQAVFMMEVANTSVDFKISVPDEDVMVDCDARQIGQAFTNLIKNATEAMGDMDIDQGKIDLEITQDDKSVQVHIIDNGKGFPEELMERLTEPYVTTRAKGTGLGLAIVKKIMRDHGGDLKLANNEDQGARAIMIFPKTNANERV